MTRKYFVSIPLYLVTLLVSDFSVALSLALYIAIAPLYALPANRFPFWKQRSAHPLETARGQQREKDASHENDAYHSL